MRKLLTKLLVFLLAVTTVFGLTGIKSVKAEDSIVNGFEIIGASVRNNKPGENDLTGIRFTTTVSQEAFDNIMTEADGREVKFGTEITDSDVGLKIQDFCYVSTVEGEDVGYVAKGAFEFYASITFNDVVFAEDVLKRLRGTEEVDLATATEEELTKIQAYKALAYAELLVAKSYYEIEGVKYYTKTLTRSMRMVANYYDKNKEELGITLPDEFYAKNYFIAGVEKYGYLEESGDVVVKDFDVTAITGVSYDANPLEFSVENGLKVTLDKAPAKLGEYTTLYAFDKTNKVTVLNLMYVTDTIATKEDLSKFDVGYTYSQAEYDALTTDAEKVAYLEKCQAEPYDYYEGYYVLTNNIDATGWTENHSAVYATATSGSIGFSVDETTNEFIVNNTNAPIVGPDGKTYLIPREGYPVRSTAASRPNTTYFKKVGFRGTLDGQGYVISNLSFSGREHNGTNYSYYDGETIKTPTLTEVMGAGILGVMTTEAEVKNIAFTNADVDFGSILAMYLIAPNTSSMSDGDVYTKGAHPTIRNMYVQTSSTRTWGVLFYKDLGVGPYYYDCFFDFTSLGKATKNDFKGTTVLGHGQISQANTGLQSRAYNMYMVVTETLVDGSAAGHGIGTGTNTNFDVTKAESLDALFASTANIHGKECNIIADYTSNPYYIVDNGRVYWKKVFESSLTLSDSSINLSEEEKTVSVDLFASGVKIAPEKVTFNKDIFKYENGAITVVNYVPGTYEATFEYRDITVVLEIVVAPITKAAYLQEDGELVGTGLNGLDTKYLTLNGEEIATEVIDGKIYLDLTGVKLPELQGYIVFALVGEYGTEINFNSQYVTVAIDEAEDLTCFNVGYTYDQAEYDKLTTDTARHEYLAYCEANPFDYYTGYYVLTKDIDASKVVFNHEAVIAPTITDAGFTYLADESNASAIKSNITAITGAITLGDKTYNIPRAGYPATNGLMNNAFDVKVGFAGTFEGNGHIITNLNATKRDVIKYYKPTDTTEMTGTAYDIGAGLFGVLHVKAIVQNVAFIDLNVSTSGGLSMYSIARSGWAAASGIAPKETRPHIFNVFVKTAKGTGNYGIFASKNNGMSSLKEMFVVVDALATTGGVDANSKLTGGINGGERSGTNAGLNAIVGYTYIASASSELYYGYSNTISTKRWMYTPSNLPTTTPTTTSKIAAINSYKELNTAVDAMGTFGDDKTGDDVSMYKAFTEEIVDTKNYTKGTYNVSSYWEVHNGLVYWKGAYEYYLNASVEEVEITDAEQTVPVSITDASGSTITENVKVSFDNEDVLEYVDGKVQVKNYIGGTYTLTFDVDGAKVNVPVTLAPINKTAYLQTDGELVGSGLESIENKIFKVNGTDVSAEMVEGKIKLDIAKLGLTTPIYTAGSATVELVGAYGTEAIYNSMYVYMAIDEASDLQKFSVNYTFNQEEYKNLPESDKEAYLAEKAVNPYTYYEGYIVLTKDIDATGITFYHDAMMYTEKSRADIGFSINEAASGDIVANTLTVVNALAQDYDGDSTISELEAKYYIPRPGYPATKSSSLDANYYYYMPGAFFYKTGYYGTFDGQGHVISNLDTTNTATIEYYVGTELNTFNGFGAGIFGAISANNVFKNLAFTEYAASKGSIFALVDITPVKEGTAAYHYDAGDVHYSIGKSPRTKFENIYIQGAKCEFSMGTLYRITAGNRGAEYDYIIVDVSKSGWGNGAYGSQNEPAYLGGSYAYSTTNGSLCHLADCIYVITYESADHPKATNTHLDIVLAPTSSELFSATTNTIGETVDIASVRFNGQPYWTIVDTDEDGFAEVYWHSLVPEVTPVE